MSANEGGRSSLRLLAELDRAAAANVTPILTGNTADVFVAADGSPRRLPWLLAGRVAACGRATVVYSLVGGARQLPPPGSAPMALRLPASDEPPAAALAEIFDQIATAPQPVQLVIDYADLILPSQPTGAGSEANRIIELLGEFALNPRAVARGHRLVLIARAGAVDPRLPRLPGFATTDVALPDLSERLCFIRRLLTPAEGAPLRLEEGLSAERLAALSGGLTLDDLLRGRDETGTGDPLGLGWVQSRKADTLRRLAGDNLVVYPPGPGLAAVAGLPSIRRLLREVAVTNRPPRRLLLAGPPGVGKTLCVTSIADELGIPAVALGNFRSMWVGESERNIRAVLNLVQSLAPCVLHIDEIDQSIGQRSTGQSADGGTSERILADLLTFLGDNTRAERVTVIATTNRPELLDPALFDRFSIIPVLHPTPAEAAQIMQIAARREGRSLDDGAALAAVEKIDRLLTGRVLVDVLDRAMTLADLEDSSGQIQQPQLDAAFADLLTALDPDEHEYLALRAIQLCTFKSHLPWTAAQALGEQPHLPGYLTPLLSEAGDLDLARLRQRVQQLESTHGPIVRR